MAKARKKTRKPAAKKAKGKTKRKTVKVKARKVVKRKAKKATKRAAPPKKQGIIASAVDTVAEALSLRRKLEGHNTFED
jgi:hypothetical protein